MNVMNDEWIHGWHIFYFNFFLMFRISSLGDSLIGLGYETQEWNLAHESGSFGCLKLSQVVP